jgi:NAD(P)-dependent dehydrogenase (short-subunit alcohol dehydrogenase family)
MKTVLITGASSGIGLATALAAARAGFQTIAGVRDEQRSRTEIAHAVEAGVDFAPLDITDTQSISDCVSRVIDKYGRLDALVNNAGVAGSNSPLEVGDPADLRATMEVNFFGTLAMTRAALPFLRAAAESREAGRLVTLSSVRGVIGQPFNEAYSASKFAIEGFMEALAPVAARAGVAVTLVQPAAVLDTSFVANSSGPEPAELLDLLSATSGSYESAFRAYREWVPVGAVEGAQTAAEVARVVLEALTMDDPPLRLQTSEFARAYVARQLTDPSGARVQAMTRSWVSQS